MIAGVCFNNAVSLPLLLVASLGSTGGLDHLVDLTPGDTIQSAMSRARSYILINALASNILRFAFGPILLKSAKSNSPSDNQLEDGEVPTHSDERTPLLSTSSKDDENDLSSKITVHPYHAHYEEQAGSRLRRAFAWVPGVFNPPLIGGFLAILFGAVPFLRHLIFDHRGPFYGSFTQSLEQTGVCYTALQMIALGAKLALKKGGKASIWAYLYLFIWRFAIMPAIASLSLCFFDFCS